MKNSNKWIAVLCMMLLISFATAAQDKPLRLEVNYVAGVPMGDFRDISDNVSGRGVELSILFPLNEKLAVGFQGGYQDFYKKFPRTIYHAPGTDISAVVTNSVQVSPIMLKARYHFGTEGQLQPYLSMAAGGNFVTYSKYYGEFVDRSSGFRFAAQPELGLFIPFNMSGSGINLGAGYSIMPFDYNDANGFHHLSLKAGVRLNLRD